MLSVSKGVGTGLGRVLVSFPARRVCSYLPTQPDEGRQNARGKRQFALKVKIIVEYEVANNVALG
jgi:hypothetical protein